MWLPVKKFFSSKNFEDPMVFYQTPFPGPHWRLSSVTGSCWGALSSHGVGQEGTNAGFPS